MSVEPNSRQQHDARHQNLASLWCWLDETHGQHRVAFIPSGTSPRFYVFIVNEGDLPRNPSGGRTRPCIMMDLYGENRLYYIPTGATSYNLRMVKEGDPPPVDSGTWGSDSSGPCATMQIHGENYWYFIPIGATSGKGELVKKGEAPPDFLFEFLVRQQQAIDRQQQPARASRLHFADPAERHQTNSAMDARHLPPLREVRLTTEYDALRECKTWNRYWSQPAENESFLRNKDRELVFLMPNFRDEDISNDWHRSHRYLHHQPIDVVLPFESPSTQDLVLPDNYRQPLSLARLLMRALRDARAHPAKAKLGCFCFALTTRIIDVVNADPLGFYMDLSGLPYIPPHFFFQLSEKAAGLNEPVRLLRRLVTYVLFARADSPVRWGGGGRYIEANSEGDLQNVFLEPSMESRSEGLRDIDVTTPGWLKKLARTGLRIIRYKDGSLRLWSPLVIRTRPDLMYYLDVRSDYKKGRIKIQRTRTLLPERAAGTKETRQDGEPEWRRIPPLAYLQDALLQRYYVAFKMFDVTMRENPFIVRVNEPIIRPEDALYTSLQGFEMPERYWQGEYEAETESEESSDENS